MQVFSSCFLRIYDERDELERRLPRVCDAVPLARRGVRAVSRGERDLGAVVIVARFAREDVKGLALALVLVVADRAAGRTM